MDISAGVVNPEPLPPAGFHILLALAGGERHGYAIMQAVQAETGGALSLGPGTLYGTIKRLLDAGWIEERTPSVDATPGNARDARRRFYALTDAGRRALGAEARRLERAVEMARARRVLGPPLEGSAA